MFNLESENRNNQQLRNQQWHIDRDVWKKQLMQSPFFLKTVTRTPLHLSSLFRIILQFMIHKMFTGAFSNGFNKPEIMTMPMFVLIVIAWQYCIYLIKDFGSSKHWCVHCAYSLLIQDFSYVDLSAIRVVIMTRDF